MPMMTLVADGARYESNWSPPRRRLVPEPLWRFGLAAAGSLRRCADELGLRRCLRTP